MSTSENRRMVEAIFDRMAAGDTPAMRDAMADDFRWVFPGNWSWSGGWGPKTVVLTELLGPLMTQFAEYRCVADAVLADGDRVVVLAHADATTTRGEEYPQQYCFVFRVADGLLVEVTEYCDTALVERVLDRPSGLKSRVRISRT